MNLINAAGNDILIYGFNNKVKYVVIITPVYRTIIGIALVVF